MFNRILKPSAFVLVVSIVGWIVIAAPSSLAFAQEDPVRFVDVGLTSHFPEKIVFNADIETDIDIVDVRVRFTTGPLTTSQYDYLDLDKNGGSLIQGELEWRVNTQTRYLPPGTTVDYHFEALDAENNEYHSETFSEIVLDARYEWDVVSRGPIHVYYYGPVQVRAERLADAAEESMLLMGPITGSEIETPIVVTLYNNNADMLGAISARSATISRELITEGQAFYDHSVVLVLSGSRDIGTLTHELTHILVGRAAGNTQLVPLWLNEGLAEYGNLDKGLSYVYYLDWAVDTNRLIPFTRLQSFPGEPNMVIVSYGQSRNFVEYLIETYGAEKVAETLAEIGSGRSGEIAIRGIYGKSIQELDNEWREAIGADPYVPVTPTPTTEAEATKAPTFGLLTLTPISGGITVGDTTSEPSPTPEPAVEPTATPQPVVQVVNTQQPPTPATTESEPEEPETSSGLCNSPGRSGQLEASAIIIALTLAAFAGRNVLRRRNHPG